jgi:hypothetical protein
MNMAVGNVAKTDVTPVNQQGGATNVTPVGNVPVTPRPPNTPAGVSGTKTGSKGHRTNMMLEMLNQVDNLLEKAFEGLGITYVKPAAGGPGHVSRCEQVAKVVAALRGKSEDLSQLFGALQAVCKGLFNFGQPVLDPNNKAYTNFPPATKAPESTDKPGSGDATPAATPDPAKATDGSKPSGSGSISPAQLTAMVEKFRVPATEDKRVGGDELRKFTESSDLQSLPKEVQLQAKFVFDKASIHELHTAGEWASKILAAKPPDSWIKENPL